MHMWLCVSCVSVHAVCLPVWCLLVTSTFSLFVISKLQVLQITAIGIPGVVASWLVPLNFGSLTLVWGFLVDLLPPILGVE
jgi:hypothetical protein